MSLPLSTSDTPTAPRRSSRPGVLGALLLAVAVANCGLDKLTGGDSAASAVTFAVAGDSVLPVGVSRPYVLTPSAPVTLANIEFAYEVSDTTLARLDSVRGSTAWVTGRRNGQLRVRLTARAPELPGGRTDSARVRVRFGAIRIDPIDTIAGLGPLNNANQRAVVVRGTRPDGTPVAGTPTVAATVVSRDTARLRPLSAGSATLVARDTGLVWVVATFDGASDSVRVPIRRRPTRIVAQPITFGALFTARAPAVRVLDAGDSAIVGAAYALSGIDTVRLGVDNTVPSAPRLVARVRDTASFVVTAATLTSPRAATTVNQVPASVVVGAGTGQSVRYGLPVPVAPRIIVRDSGGQGVSGVPVTFGVPNAGNGTVTGASQVTNAAGEATVGGWALGPNAGTDSLSAAVSGLPTTIITAIALPGAPARVRFTVQPQGAGVGRPVQPAPQVVVQDSIGNLIASAADSITVSPATPGVGGTAGGRVRVAAQGGVARFDSLVFSDTAAAVRLVASLPGLAPDTSTAFPIGTAATQLVFITQPANTTGGRRLAPITLEFRDASGQRAAGAADSVTLTLVAGNGAVLAGTTRRAAVAGRVTFDDVSVALIGSNYSVSASGAGFSATSSTFFISAGPPARLLFRDAPANVAPGMTQSLQVVSADSGGNIVNANGTVVVLRLSPNPGSATLTDSVQVVNFATAFFNPSVSAAGDGYRFQATAAGLASATSAPFNVRAPGTAARVRFVSKAPVGQEAGGRLPQVELVDASGVRLSTPRFPYTVVILSGPSGATLTSNSDSAFFAGVSLPNIRLRTAGTYRLIVGASGLPADTSGPITVVPGNGTRLVTILQPSAVGVAAPVTAQVSLADSLGNPTTRLNFSDVSNTLGVSVSATDGAGASVVLGGTTTRTTSGGIATFDDITLPAAGTGNRLTFSSPGVTSVTSDTFTVRVPGAATRLRVSTLPATINGGSAITPAFRVNVVDANGTVVASRTDAISLALRGPAGATFTGPATVAAVNGAATFAALRIPRADSGLRLVATSADAAIAADSTPVFRVSVGPASQVRVLSSPSAIIAGAVVAPPVLAAVTDSGGNVITAATDSIDLNFLRTSNQGFFLASGRPSRRAVAGVAAFDSVLVFGAGTIQWVAVGRTRFLDAVPSGNVAVQQGPPVKPRAFVSTERRYIESGLFANGQIWDAGNSLVDTSSATVTVSIASGPVGATIVSGTTTTAANGQWSFGSIRVSQPGSYRLRFTASGMAGADTTPVLTVVGRPVRAQIVAAPTTGVRGGRLGAVRVVPVDTLGQPIPAFSLNNVVSIAYTGPGGVTGTTSRVLSSSGGDTVVSAVFSDLLPSTAGSGRFVATMAFAGTTPDTSALVTVAPFSAAQSLRFTTQPTNLVVGQTMPVSPVVTVIDSVGNLVTDNVSRSIAVALATNPGNAILSGTLSVTLAPGSATAAFPSLSLNALGTGYVLLATATGLNAAASATFNVVATTDAISLRVLPTTVPSTVQAGAALTGTGGTLAVEAINSAGTRVTSFTGPITLTLQGNAAPIVGTATVTAVSGVATFTAASVQRAGAGYVFTASSPGMVTATAASATTVTAAAAARLVALDSMPATVAGNPWPSQRVAITDAFGNPVPSASATVTIRAGQIFPGDSSYVTWGGSGALGGIGAAAPVLSATTVNGVATFSGLRPRRTTEFAAVFATLYFDAPGLTSARSPRFDVSSARADRLVTGVNNKSDWVNNEPLLGFVFVSDSLGNSVSTANGSVTLGLRRRNGTPLPSGLQLSAAPAITVSNGFGNFSRDRQVTGVTAPDTVQLSVAASTFGLPQDTLSSGNIFLRPFAAASQLAFRQQPTNAARNANVSPAVQVAVTDSLGNVVNTLSTGTAGLTGTISLELTNGSTVGGPTTVLLGGGPLTLVNGVATFPGVQINNAGTGYRLLGRVTAGTSVPGVTSTVLSALFNITP